MIRFASLGSGSKGNATLIAAGDTLVMVDCGFSQRETTRRMQRLGVDPARLDAILVTHEHSDHCAGVPGLSRRHGIPVHMSHGTHSSGRCDGCADVVRFDSDHSFSIGDLQVTAVSVPDDAREPCQFRFGHAGRSLGLLTDLGSVTPHVVASFRGCDGLLLEFNHDREMLLQGPYPAHLKRRVGGDWGHLNNDQAVSLLDQWGGDGPSCLVVAHVSEQNNCRRRAAAALQSASHQPEEVVWAGQGHGFDWLQLD